MKKFFKSPTEVKDTKALIKALKSTFGKMGTDAFKFFYKVDFEYADKATAPFIYIGTPPSNWKKYAKDNKASSDFALGLCKIEKDSSGNQKLLLCVEKGKGGKSTFLKSLNKEVLRKTGTQAMFVETIQAPAAVEEDNEDDSEENNTASEAITSEAVSPKAHVESIKGILSEFRTLQAEFDDEKLDAIIEAIDDWQDDHETLDQAIQDKLGDADDKASKVKAYLKKLAVLDAKLEDELADAAVYLEEWYEIEDDTSVEAKILEKLILKKVSAVEVVAERIKDKKILGYCSELKAYFA